MLEIISIIIPTRNEERYIEDCLKSVVAFNVPKGLKVEILVIDGMSDDKTKDIVVNLSTQYNFITFYENRDIIQSAALNKGILNSKGNYIMRLDAHAKYPRNYLASCFEASIFSKADNVGGIVITLPGGDNFQASLVQAMTTHKFGVGGSVFRTEEIIGDADTVPFGFFKKEIFEKIGLFDERLIRCQDYEFNRRIIKNGGKIWMNSKIYSEYFNQPTLKDFYLKQFYKEAPYNPYMWYLAPYSFTFRHAVTGIFSSGIFVGAVLSIFSPLIKIVFIATLLLYFILALLSSIKQAKRYKKNKFIFLLPGCFFLYHFIHGLGILKGLLNLIVQKAPVQLSKKAWDGYDEIRRHKGGNVTLPKT